MEIGFQHRIFRATSLSMTGITMARLKITGSRRALPFGFAIYRWSSCCLILGPFLPRNERANDVCKDGKRQSINAEDVFKALDEIEFPEFVDPLRTTLEAQDDGAALSKGREGFS